MKKIIIVSLFVLVFLLLLLALFQSLRMKKSSGTTSTTSPTGIATKVNRGSQNNIMAISPNPFKVSEGKPLNAQDQQKATSLRERTPFETKDFIVDYSPELQKIVVTKKTPEADVAISDWARTNGFAPLLSNADIVLITDKTVSQIKSIVENSSLSLSSASSSSTSSAKTEDQIRLEQQAKLVSAFLDIFLAPPPPATGTPYPTAITVRVPSPTIPPSPTPKSSGGSSSGPTEPPKDYGGYVYYSQCSGSYDNYPLPGGCTECKAGCGPTSVSMILSSYVDKKYTPPEVIDGYNKAGMYIGCAGSRIGDAKSFLESHGVQTTDYIVSSALASASTVASDFRSYLKNGWTIFALANYCEEGCGHFFWVTDIDSNGNILAFDPYYGKDTKPPPFNENRYNPFPKYRYAFAVKKK